MAPPTGDLLVFCRSLPKVELHAHLNGSVREATIRELLAENPSAGVSEDDVDRVTRTGVPYLPIYPYPILCYQYTSTGMGGYYQ